MKRLLFVAAVAALLVPPPVQAKGSATVRVCGPHECVTLDDRAAYALGPAETVPEPPPTAAYYRVDVSFEAGGERETYSTLFVPSSGLVGANAGGGGLRTLLWYVPQAETLNQLRSATRGLDAYEPPAAWPVFVDRSAPADEPSEAPPYDLAAAVILVLLSIVALAARFRPRQARTA